jgi:hypothetical protein
MFQHCSCCQDRQIESPPSDATISTGPKGNLQRNNRATPMAGTAESKDSLDPTCRPANTNSWIPGGAPVPPTHCHRAAVARSAATICPAAALRVGNSKARSSTYYWIGKSIYDPKWRPRLLTCGAAVCCHDVWQCNKCTQTVASQGGGEPEADIPL